MARVQVGGGRLREIDEKLEGQKAKSRSATSWLGLHWYARGCLAVCVCGTLVPLPHREARAVCLCLHPLQHGWAWLEHTAVCTRLLGCVCVVHWFLKGGPGRDTDFDSLLFDVLSGSPKS